VLLIDPRVGSVDLLPHLQKFDIPCRTEPLEYGDFVFTGHGPGGTTRTYAFERKRLLTGDMIRSMRDGRLSGHQLIGLLDTYHSIHLIVEGIYRPGRDGILEYLKGNRFVPADNGRIMYRELDAFLTTLSQICGVQVLRSTSDYETAVMLATRYLWSQKPWESHRGHLALHDNTPAWERLSAGVVRPTVRLIKPSLLRRVANQIDKIGWEKSKLVAEHFRSVRAMANAEAAEWRRIDGVGKTIADSVVKQLNGVR